MPDLDAILDDLEAWLSRRHGAPVSILWWATSDGVVSIATGIATDGNSVRSAVQNDALRVAARLGIDVRDGKPWMIAPDAVEPSAHERLASVARVDAALAALEDADG